MTVEEMIAERTVKVTAALDEANDTISLKGGTPSADLHGLSAAIDSIPHGSGQPYEEITFTSAVIIENGYYGLRDFWSNYIQDISDVYAILCDMKYKQTYQFLGSISDAKNLGMTSPTGPAHLSYRTSMWQITQMDAYSTYTIPAGTVFRVYRKWW